jgi:hypothetical protein
MQFDTYEKAACYGRLLHDLDLVDYLDQSPEPDYPRRYALLIHAHLMSGACGIASGFRIDPANPDWPVLFFELPAGQVSWHMPQHGSPWDGHTNKQKHERIQAALQEQREGTWRLTNDNA